jgi:hypothetical protein
MKKCWTGTNRGWFNFLFGYEPWGWLRPETVKRQDGRHYRPLCFGVWVRAKKGEKMKNYCSYGHVQCGRYHDAQNLFNLSGGCELLLGVVLRSDPEVCLFPSKQLVICSECGQIDHGQTGEHPCKECGLPWIHDVDVDDLRSEGSQIL